MPQPTAQSSTDIAAPADLLYELVSDVTELPKWAAETYRCKWLGDADDGAAVGAKFRGSNEHGKRKWATTCVVTAADLGKRFAFRVQVAGVPSALWRYDIEPIEGGCRVTESTRRISPRLVTMLVNRVFLGVHDRDETTSATSSGRWRS